MYCMRCGKKIEPGEKVCRYCGNVTLVGVIQEDEQVVKTKKYDKVCAFILGLFSIFVSLGLIGLCLVVGYFHLIGQNPLIVYKLIYSNETFVFVYIVPAISIFANLKAKKILPSFGKLTGLSVFSVIIFMALIFFELFLLNGDLTPLGNLEMIVRSI